MVQESDEIYIDRLKNKDISGEIEFDTLASGNLVKNSIKLGQPTLTAKVKGKIIEELKADKIRVSRFKAKTRYRKTRGFRHYLSKVKIISI